MSLELDTRVWFRAGMESFSQRLNKLMSLVQPRLGGEGTWNRITIKQGVPGNKVYSSDSSEEIANLASNFPDLAVAQDLQVTVYGAFACWRFQDGEASQGAVTIAVSLSGPEYGTGIGLDPELEGHAKLTLLDAGPFFGLLDEYGEMDANQPLNAQIEENTSSVIDLLAAVSQEMPVSKMLTWTDVGPTFVPHNAHIAYFHSPAEFNRALAGFKELLQQGQAKYHVPSIIAAPKAPASWCAHSFRPEEREAEIAERMFKVAQSDSRIAMQVFTTLKNSGHFDMLENGDQFFVMEYPFFLNAFLDEFFIRGLEA